MLTRIIFVLLTALSLVSSPLADQKTVNPGPPHLQTTPDDFILEFYPVAPYHVGDVLSVRITYTGQQDMGGNEIMLFLAETPGDSLETTTFSHYNQQAVFYWVLDTKGFEPSFVRFRFTIPELEETWTAGINLLPTPPGREARWETIHTECCTLHFISGTDAAEDIQIIQEAVQEEVSSTLSQFFPDGVPSNFALEHSLTLNFIPVAVGHGGFASDEAVITYNHHNWLGSDFETLIHHEMVHVLDRQLNDEGPRPRFLSEGLAVYLSGGHYQQEDILVRAAALLQTGMYLPLTDIMDDFYAAQHEIGYAEAGALVSYMIRRWGWESYIDFYFNLPEGDSDTDIISTALKKEFGLDLTTLETEFKAYLQGLEPSVLVQADVRLTVQLYDAVRRYQSLAIPSAHFRTAWWPPVDHMRENEITGDYAFREKSPSNIIIENLFQEVHQAREKKAYAHAEEALNQIHTYLNIFESEGEGLSHYTLGAPLPVQPAHEISP
jgi:hypothetical protein